MSGEPLQLHRKLLTDHPQVEEGDNGDNKGDNIDRATPRQSAMTAPQPGKQGEPGVRLVMLVP